ELGTDVSQVIQIMMAKDPNDRYQSYEELMTALGSLQSQSLASPPSGGSSTSTTVRSAASPATPTDAEQALAEIIPAFEEALTPSRDGDKARGIALLRSRLKAHPRDEEGGLRLPSTAASPVEVVTPLQRVLEINPANTQARVWIHKARLMAGIA